ncbi:MAG: Fic family protein [Candidatus Brocadiae bacterium]|nr:Fic family protein [Candidatus Brocadiia bacterium]
MRTYERTHPWLTFSVDLSHAPAALWVMLGECQSKCEHIAGAPLRPETAESLHRLFLAKGALATTAIEGNTLTEEQVIEHLEGKLKLPPSQEYLAQEIDNIVTACNGIFEKVRTGRASPLTVESIKELNRTVLDKLDVAEDVIPGQVRTHRVTVARYRAVPPEDCEFLLGRFCDWLNGLSATVPAGMSIAYGILRAVLGHLYLAWIHPFGDGNGRTARLVEFQTLVSAGVPTPAAHLLSNHYNQTRSEYYRQLDTATRSGGEVVRFLVYAVTGLLDGLRSQLDQIRQQEWDVVWRNYVHERFGDRTTPSQVRRRHLVLDLSRQAGWVPISDLGQISTRIARAYATKTRKTLMRDINALEEMGLVARDGRRVRARKDIIRAFLPAKAATEQVPQEA